MNYSDFKKLAFFWLIIHTVAFLSFKLQWTPSFTTEEKDGSILITNYILTPKYSDGTRTVTLNNGVRKVIENAMFPNCESCDFIESENFYPFHEFNYSIYRTKYNYNRYTGQREGQQEATKGFVGIFGYYGNNEYIVYVIIPVIVWLLLLLYKKLFKNN